MSTVSDVWGIRVDGESLEISDEFGKQRFRASLVAPHILGAHIAFALRENERLRTIAREALVLAEEFDPEEEHYPRLIGSIRKILGVSKSNWESIATGAEDVNGDRLDQMGPLVGNDAGPRDSRENTDKDDRGPVPSV